PKLTNRMPNSSKTDIINVKPQCDNRVSQMAPSKQLKITDPMPHGKKDHLKNMQDCDEIMAHLSALEGPTEMDLLPLTPADIFRSPTKAFISCCKI
ncbi:Hypothetical predicted protein, partial [Pelobates cultripes]